MGFRSLSNPFVVGRTNGDGIIKEEINRKKKKKERIFPSDTLLSMRMHTTDFDNWKKWEKWKVGELHITLPIRFIQASNSDDGGSFVVGGMVHTVRRDDDDVTPVQSEDAFVVHTFFLFPCWQRHEARGSSERQQQQQQGEERDGIIAFVRPTVVSSYRQFLYRNSVICQDQQQQQQQMRCKRPFR